MTDLTTNSIPKATGATEVSDSGFSDASAGDIFAALSDTKGYIDFDEAPNFAISSPDPDFVFALIPVLGGTSSPVFTLDSVGTGNGGSFEFMNAQGVGGAPLACDDYDYLGSIYWAGLDTGLTVRDVVTVSSRAGPNFAAAPNANFEIKTRNQLESNQPRLTIDWDGDTNIQNGNLITESHVPASASATGKAGTVTWGDGFVYVCVATDTWQRAALATWP
jgi:hypothetical protein